MPKTQRLDFEAICAIVSEGARVLDLGCGDGALLERLVREKRVVARGVELSEENVRACIGRGLSVRHGNIEEGLADYRDGAFDYVILSMTLAYLNQPAPVVREMLRVGKKAVVSFDHAGYWRRRLQAARGRGMGQPLDSGEPRERMITIDQFLAFARALDADVERAVLLAGTRAVRWRPSLRATAAVYVLRRR